MNPPLVPVLSIDPSSTKIGWALIGSGPRYLASGVWHVPDAPPDERVRLVGAGINVIMQTLRQGEWGLPARAVIELPDFITEKGRPVGLILYFRAVGVAEYVVSRWDVPIEYEKASKLKENTRKAAAKERFRQVVGRHPLTDDESDAFCIGWDYVSERLPPAGGDLPERRDDNGGWDDFDAEPEHDPGPEPME